MSDWVFGYQVSVLQLAQYAYAHNLCESYVSKGYAMELAIEDIVTKTKLPKWQRSLAMCWTKENPQEPELVWKLSERVNTHSSSELRVLVRDVPPDPRSLIKLAAALGKDHMPRWYIREASYSRGENRVRGWSAEDEAEIIRKGTYDPHNSGFSS